MASTSTALSTTRPLGKGEGIDPLPPEPTDLEIHFDERPVVYGEKKLVFK